VIANKVRLSGHDRYGKTCSTTFQFDDQGKLRNPLTVAKSGMIGWGPWQSSHKVPCRFGACWWVSTPGHGGYILVNQIDRLWNHLDPAMAVCEPHYGKAFAYEFEEDCCWAILEFYDEDVRRWALSRYNTHRVTQNEPEFTELEYMARCVIPELRRWNPLILEDSARVRISGLSEDEREGFGLVKSLTEGDLNNER